MIYFLNSQQIIGQFTLSNGTTYPAGWLQLSSPTDRSGLGFVTLTEVFPAVTAGNGYDGTYVDDFVGLTRTYGQSAIPIVGDRVVTMADATSITPTPDTADTNIQTNTQVAGTLTVNVPRGVPTDGKQLYLRITSTNVQTFAWNSIYESSSSTSLPTVSTGGGKTDIFLMKYNAITVKWQIINAQYGYS